MFLGDFNQALDFSSYLLERKLHDNNGPKAKLKRLAFDTALVISYSRPFIRNKDAEGQIQYSPLTHNIAVKLLIGAEIDLHKKVLKQRNKIFAHSDAEFRLFPGQHRFMPDPFPFALSEADTMMLRTIIKKWIKHIRAELGGGSPA